MSWKRGRSGVADAKYQTRAYRIAKEAQRNIIATGNGWCVQGLFGSSGTCVFPTRHIPSGADWDLAHDDQGTTIIGAAHSRCNRVDGGQRSRLKQPIKRWTL